ncbi:MAG: tRNA uridine-5-carboxymethylaminomethyl(34) synthesis GTPase MnmE [Candidatus Omnitrophica bacterium]|nr:tRNA uridine-5-carboxymethylaminomethyl(34) synthesis GTPase MnmE [Candidatus Omnitrophota bacterium]MBU4457988.1 tRNA uridine-5-carboxymethylaminomethyl(34) synthesis GTPase MnmE [Candidatus Omnitrophota bacterium]
MLDDTIVAISTPVGEGGIGIVRLSGRDSLKIADKVFVSKNGKRPSRFKTYTVHYGTIRDNKGIVDEVILTVMRAPRSYTKEDVVEINCHSGIVPLRKTLDLVLKNGARLAEPGEFTKRAFLNGRIDISQAESVLDIIRSKTDLSLKLAVNNLEGLLSKKINCIREGLMDILVRIEASIDFSEEEDVFTKKKDILNKLSKVNKALEKLILSRDQGKILRQGINTVICGSPNVGKSSLMNALLKESRAIVTHIPGTTRDTIEEVINIKGIPVVLTDTAGINKTDHPVEREGVKRSHDSVQAADLILVVLDNGRLLNKNDRDIIKNIKDRDNVIIVVNKDDLKAHIDIKDIKKILPGRPIIKISALNQSNIDKLEDVIYDMVFKGKIPSPDFVGISNSRQLDILRRSHEEVRQAIDAVKSKASMDCVAIYVRSSIEAIGEITGDTITEEALDKIFAEFCVGK